MKANIINLFKNIDKILAILVSIFSFIILIYLSFASSRVHALAAVYLIISALTLIYCSIYLLIRNKSLIVQVRGYESKKNVSFLFYIFLINYIYSIYLIYNGMIDYQLSLYYYLVISFMCAIIALEIIYSIKSMRYIILFQIIILGLNISMSQLIIFPNILGVDPWWHYMITNKIINSNFIPQSPYQELPIFHLLLAIISKICNIDYKNATILNIILPQIILDVLFLYMITFLIFKKYKISLMSSLILIIGNYFIQFNFAPIPNSLSVLFLIIILYLVIKIKNKIPKISILTVIFMLTIILTHTFGAAITALVLFTYWFVINLFSYMHNIKRDNSIFFKISVSFTIAMFSWWTYASGPLFSLVTMIKNDFSIDYFLKLSSQTSNYFPNSVPQSEKILNLFGMLLFFSTAIIGILIMISKRGNINSFYIASLGIILLMISFISFLIGRYILNDRWYYISEILLSIPLSMSLFILSNIRNNKIYKPILIFIFMTTLAFTNIISPVANINNPLLTPNTLVRYAFTKAEIVAASFTAKNTIGQISSDFYYAYSPSSSIFENQFNINNTRILSLDNSLLSNQFVHDLSIKVIRKEIVYNSFVVESGIWKLIVDPNKLLINSGFDKVYDNGGVCDYR